MLIIITDGGDTTSYTNFRTAIEAAHAADAVIYSLIVQPIKSDAGRNVGGERTLWMFAEGTGGKAFVEYGEEGLNRAFSEILENIRTQYLLAYYPPEHDDYKTRFREIQVKVDVEKATVLARSGYYVPKERKLLPESVVAPPVETPRPKGRWRSGAGVSRAGAIAARRTSRPPRTGTQSMNNVDYVSTAIEIAKEAGETLRRFQEKGFQVEYKGDFDVVTAADRAAEEVVVTHLKSRFPNHSNRGRGGRRRRSRLGVRLARRPAGRDDELRARSATVRGQHRPREER